jgi:alkylhydroperoxidase/carboxymuconolactone decarboxylase family protein YurZ
MTVRRVVRSRSGLGEPCPAGDISFDVLEHPKLSQRDRNLIAVAFLVALNRTAELPFHSGGAPRERSQSPRNH